MKTQTNHIYKKFIFSFILLIGASATGHADITASEVIANISKYEGKNVTFNIPFVRSIPAGPEEGEGIRFLVAPTVDEDNRSLGGHILIVASTQNYDSLIKKYGTSVERDGKKPELNQIRGTIRVLNHEDSKGKRDRIYLDTTDSTDLSEIIKARLSQHIDNPDLGPGKEGAHGGKGLKKPK